MNNYIITKTVIVCAAFRSMKLRSQDALRVALADIEPAVIVHLRYNLKAIIADEYTSVHNMDYLCARDAFWIRHTVSAKDYCAHVEGNRAKYRIEKDRVIVEKSLKEEIVKHNNTIGKAFVRLGEIICGVCTLLIIN
jgi:hypothetical protein